MHLRYSSLFEKLPNSSDTTRTPPWDWTRGYTAIASGKGKAPAHPFPELVVFDEMGEATLTSDRDMNLKLWQKHDKWYRDSCPHAGYLVQKRLGNIAVIAHVRGFLEDNSSKSFPLPCERVVHSGIHTGDWIADVPQLLEESKKLKSLTTESVIVEFANDVIELAEASIATGNPIVF